jgi:endonuclease/exonuclease/phosphatase family metal-dependent hydrolase
VAAIGDHAPVAITFVTWNLFNHEPTFAARLPLIVRTLAAQQADVAALQEVPPEGGVEYALARELDYDSVASVSFLRPDDGWSERLVVLSRLPIVEFEPLELRPGVPNALRTRLVTGKGRLDLYNVHQHPRDEALRQREIGRVLATADARRAVPAVVAGDFNATPGTAGFGDAHGFRSAYEMANGEHPARTFATPLRRDLERLPAVALDHVLVEPARVKVIGAGLFGQAVAEGEWPSDHWGLRVTLEMKG